jgi:hypothetical protein
MIQAASGVSLQASAARQGLSNGVIEGQLRFAVHGPIGEVPAGVPSG